MRNKLKFLFLTASFSLLASFTSFAGGGVTFTDADYVQDAYTRYDPNNGCTYGGQDVIISGSTDDSYHYASSGKTEGSSFTDRWHIEETATGRVWVENGKTKENADVWIQEDGTIVTQIPGKWEKTEDGWKEVDKDDINPIPPTKGDPGETQAVGNDIDNVDDSSAKGDDDDEIHESEKPNETLSPTPDIEGVLGDTNEAIENEVGDIQYEDGKITGTMTFPGGEEWDFSIVQGEDGEWKTESYHNEETGEEHNITVSRVEDFTVQEKSCYTFTGDNLDNELISASERHTDFNIGMWEHDRDSFRFVMRIPGTWKIDCTFWELLGLWKRITVYDSVPNGDGTYSSTSYTKEVKVGTRLEHELVRPQFPQYVPVPEVCKDCPPIEICVNGECDCVDNVNTSCSNTDREEAEKQFDTYDINADSVLEK